jgi:hypothetical protein
MTATNGGHPTMDPDEAVPAAWDLGISVADGPGASAGDPAWSILKHGVEWI